jgi:hydrogenase expression/formation protein HypD
MSVLRAQRAGLTNYSILTSHVLVPPAMRAILTAADNQVQGFLAAGHVCAIMGVGEYGPIARQHRVPIIVTGFEPVDILEGILRCVRQLESGRAEVENAYSRAVRAEGNAPARAIVEQVFSVSDRDWRGLGMIPASGLAVKPEFAAFDAARKFTIPVPRGHDSGVCISGEIMRGVKKPLDCPAFGTRCKPEHPLGAPMVSSEGACAAYYRYRNRMTATVEQTA